MWLCLFSPQVNAGLIPATSWHSFASGTDCTHPLVMGLGSVVCSQACRQGQPEASSLLLLNTCSLCSCLILTLPIAAHLNAVPPPALLLLLNMSLCACLQDFLGFAPSKQALAIVQRSLQAQATQQQQVAASRLRLAAALTAQRCTAAPVYGQDLRQVGTESKSSRPAALSWSQLSSWLTFLCLL